MKTNNNKVFLEGRRGRLEIQFHGLVAMFRFFCICICAVGASIYSQLQHRTANQKQNNEKLVNLWFFVPTRLRKVSCFAANYAFELDIWT